MTLVWGGGIDENWDEIFFGDMMHQIPITAVDKVLEEIHFERRRILRDIEKWADDRPNEWYNRRPFREWYSPTPCYRRINGKYKGVHRGWTDFRLYMKTGLGEVYQGHDNLRWAHEELHHIINDYCSYNFWGNWNWSGDPAAPLTRWMWTDGAWWVWDETTGGPFAANYEPGQNGEAFGFESHTNIHNYIHRLMKYTDLVNYLHKWYYDKEPIALLDNL